MLQFFRQLFCAHNYVRLGEVGSFSFVCEKCENIISMHRGSFRANMENGNRIRNLSRQ